jgi:hypothetical protein
MLVRQRGIYNNEGISFPSKVGTLDRDKELRDSSSARYIQSELNKMTIMGTKLNTVCYPA